MGFLNAARAKQIENAGIKQLPQINFGLGKSAKEFSSALYETLTSKN